MPRESGLEKARSFLAAANLGSAAKPPTPSGEGEDSRNAEGMNRISLSKDISVEINLNKDIKARSCVIV